MSARLKDGGHVDLPRRRGRLVAGGYAMAAGVAMLLVGLGNSVRPTAALVLGGLCILVGVVLFASHLNRLRRIASHGADLVPSHDDRSAEARPGSSSEPDFTVSLRGYDRGQVDELVRRADAALASPSEFQRLAVRAEIEAASLSITMRGYYIAQVDAFLKEMAAALESPPSLLSPESPPPGAAS